MAYVPIDGLAFGRTTNAYRVPTAPTVEFDWSTAGAPPASCTLPGSPARSHRSGVPASKSLWESSVKQAVLATAIDTVQVGDVISSSHPAPGAPQLAGSPQSVTS